jgi:low temperature requirement protein LtrA
VNREPTGRPPVGAGIPVLPGQGGCQRRLLRDPARGDQVSPIELFFDLVFVFAVTQLSHRLLDHLTVGGAAATLLLLLAVWSAWITTTWVTHWFDPDRLPVRLMLIGVMLASLFMSAAIPGAFGERGLTFGIAIAAIHVGRAGFAYVSLRISPDRSNPLTRTFQHTLSWHAAAGTLWVAGGLAEGRPRYLLWGLALVFNFVAPAIGYYVPGLGAVRTTEWAIQAVHFTERFRLFIIIALGESLLVTGAAYGAQEASAASTAAFLVAFGGSVALWWIYFHRSAEEAGRVLASTTDPGRLARSAYSMFHLPMVGGIIAIAAADELTVAHPGDPGTPASVALTLGGTALFLAGHAPFKRTVFERPPWPGLVAILVLAALVPVGFAASALLLSAATGLVLVALAAWDARTPLGRPPRPRRSAV